VENKKSIPDAILEIRDRIAQAAIKTHRNPDEIVIMGVSKNASIQAMEEAYHAGLMCDIGKLAFEVILRDINDSKIDWQGRSFSELEIEIFGIDHAQMGAELAKRWMLPISLQKGIEFHHQPGKAGEYIRIASSVHIADMALTMLGIGIGKDGLRYNIDPIAFEVTGWNPERLPELISLISEQIKSAEEFIGMAGLL